MASLLNAQLWLLICALCGHLCNAGSQLVICPTPQKCRCDTNRIMCAFMGFEVVPYFIQFTHTWSELDLSENLIRHLPANCFRGVRVLSLNLQRNVIASIHEHAFVGFQQLTTLDLSDNFLEYLTAGVFSGLSHMQTLILRNNKLTQNGLDQTVFHSLPALRNLILSGNEFSEVPTMALRSAHQLKRLELRGNMIQQIHAYAFDGMPLLHLDLGNNAEAMSIHDDAFCGLEPTVVSIEPEVINWSGMRVLLLDHNGLRMLSPCVVKTMWTLDRIDMSGNPLVCDCRMFVFNDISGSVSLPRAQCAEPRRSAGKFLGNIDRATYICVRNSTMQLCGGICVQRSAAAQRAIIESLLVAIICGQILRKFMDSL